MPPKKKHDAPSAAPVGLSPRDMTWRHYSDVMDKFRKLCHSDKVLFEQAENRVKAKRVAASYQSRDKAAIDPLMLSKMMTDYVLDLEDEKEVDALYRAKLAFRDRVCNSLGKLPDDKWDAFHERCATSKQVPHTVKMFELAGKP